MLEVLLGVSGCGSSEKGAVKKADAPGMGAPKLKIVTTIFPEYSWTKEILGSNDKGVELTLLTRKGVDMHSYQPGAEDILRIANSDLFIYVGGESDRWVDKALKESANPKRRVINLMKLLGNRAKVEEAPEDVEKQDRSDHHDTDNRKDKHEHDKGKHEHDKNEHHHNGAEYDEHVWLSLKNADIACKAIAEEMAVLDQKNAGTYRANYDSYSKKLKGLDAQYRDAVEKAPVRAVLFGDRFPFRYLADDYGLKYYAAFNGCSAETEASFQTIALLAGKMDEFHLPAVLTIEGQQHKLAQTIVGNTKAKNQKVLTLNSMQAVPEAEIKKGLTYFSLMEDNLKVLQEALQAQ